MTEGILNQIELEKEDDLTEAVFGGLGLLGNDLLEEVIEGVPIEGDLSVEFREELDSQSQRIPDVVIESESSVVLIEAKRGSPYNENQLKEEYEDLKSYTEKERLLVLVTEHSSSPEGINDLNMPEEEFMWLGWRDIYTELKEVKQDSELHQTEERVIELVSGILEDEGYTQFTGFESVRDEESLLHNETSNAWDIFADAYEQLNTFRRDIDGKISGEGLTSEDLYRNGRSQSAGSLGKDHKFVTAHIWFTYVEPGSEVQSKSKDDYYYVSFSFKYGNIRVGYAASPKHSDEAKRLFNENAEAIAEYIDDKATLYQTTSELYLRDEINDREEAREKLNNEDWLTEEWRVHIGYSHAAEELIKPTLTDTVANELIEIHQFVEELD